LNLNLLRDAHRLPFHACEARSRREVRIKRFQTPAVIERIDQSPLLANSLPHEFPERTGKHRACIDVIDAKLLELLSGRGKEAQAIGRIKQRQGSSFHARTRSLAATFRSLNHWVPSNIAPLKDFSRILPPRWRQRRPQGRLPGPEATYTHLAAICKFGIATQFLLQTTPREVSRGG
jgi:chorismate mutase